MELSQDCYREQVGELEQDCYREREVVGSVSSGTRGLGPLQRVGELEQLRDAGLIQGTGRCRLEQQRDQRTEAATEGW